MVVLHFHVYLTVVIRGALSHRLDWMEGRTGTLVAGSLRLYEHGRLLVESTRGWHRYYNHAYPPG